MNVTLPGGREVEYDLSKCSVKEYEALFDPGHPIAEERAMLARVTGISVEEQSELSVLDNKFLWKHFYKFCREPLQDPN